MRYAVYFTPPKEDPLTQLAASWLGRDAFSGTLSRSPDTSSLSSTEIAFHTAAPRRYGFHATLKAPFRLEATQSEGALVEALVKIAADAEPFSVPLAVGQLDGFFALLPGEPVPALHKLADDVVRDLDQYRAPLSEAEIERRNPDALNAEEFGNLQRWGYPYVFENFRFHMTLTGRVAGADADRVRAALNEVFAPVLVQSVSVEGLGLFVEPEPGVPFIVHSYCPFAPKRERKSA